MIELDKYNELKEQIKQEVFQELIKELPERCNNLYKEIETVGLDKDKVYVVKIYFIDNIDVDTLQHSCYAIKEMMHNIGIDCIIVPLRKGGDICDIKIEGDPNVE